MNYLAVIIFSVSIESKKGKKNIHPLPYIHSLNVKIFCVTQIFIVLRLINLGILSSVMLIRTLRLIGSEEYLQFKFFPSKVSTEILLLRFSGLRAITN